MMKMGSFMKMDGSKMKSKCSLALIPPLLHQASVRCCSVTLRIRVETGRTPDPSRRANENASILWIGRGLASRIAFAVARGWRPSPPASPPPGPPIRFRGRRRLVPGALAAARHWPIAARGRVRVEEVPRRGAAHRLEMSRPAAAINPRRPAPPTRSYTPTIPGASQDFVKQSIKKQGQSNFHSTSLTSNIVTMVEENVNKTGLHPQGIKPQVEHTEIETELHDRAHIDWDRVAIIANPSVPSLYEDALVYETGSAVTSTGALSAYSGTKTGRSPSDKRIVKEESSENEIWWGPVNKSMTPDVRLTACFPLC
nr:phosphoenolpyruvate carboxykinase (atp) [Quercus suber]